MRWIQTNRESMHIFSYISPSSSGLQRAPADSSELKRAREGSKGLERIPAGSSSRSQCRKQILPVKECHWSGRSGRSGMREIPEAIKGNEFCRSGWSGKVTYPQNSRNKFEKQILPVEECHWSGRSGWSGMREILVAIEGNEFCRTSM